MHTKRLGSSGLVVSVVGLGCNNMGWRIDEAQARAVVDAALDAGITLFDTAEATARGDSEVFLGRALAGRRDRVGVRDEVRVGDGRDDEPAARRSRLRPRGDRGLAAAARHRPRRPLPVPPPRRRDPVAETLGAMDELVREGKVRYIGHSNLSAAQVVEADEAAAALGLTPYVSAQNEYSWLARDAERDLIPACERLGLGLLPYFPLARGLLTGKYRRGEPAPEGTRLAAQGLDADEATWDRVEALGAFARDRGLRLLDVAIGGLAAQPTVASVIAGATTPEQVRANVAAGEWVPAPDELAALRLLL